LATVARLTGPGGARAVVAESVLVKHQLLILNRSRKRSPNLRLADRLVAGVCTLLMRPSRLVRSAGECRFVSLAAALSRALSDADGGVRVCARPRRPGNSEGRDVCRPIERRRVLCS
jgi:hypothetical protein